MSDTQYIVSARKYRPTTFASVVGQKNLTATLKNSIASGRLAQAYLFCGPRGVGKTSCARIFARTINCTNPTPDGEACGECDSCMAISKGNSFNLIELDAASNNSVDDIRTLIEQVNVPPQQGRYKVFIIDEVHMLSSQAFNAFLKTLEEPPKYAIFILATTEKHKVIPTILSRCQIYDFKRITVDDAVEHLKFVAADKGISADPRALGVIARKADGAMRDALSIFDQVAASSNGDITYESTIENLNVLDYDYYFRLVDAFASHDVSGALLIYKEIRDKGFDSLFFINGLASHIRDLMVAADPRTLPLLEVDNDMAESFKKQTSQLPIKWYYDAMKILNHADFSYRASGNKQLLVEVSLIRLCQLNQDGNRPFDLAEELPSLRNPIDFISGIGSESQVIDTPMSTPPPPSPHPAASEPASPVYLNPTSGSLDPSAGLRPIRTRPRTTRLSDLDNQEVVNTLQVRNSPFTDEEFEQAWSEFQTRNPDQQLLLSAMRGARKIRVDNTKYSLLLGHRNLIVSIEQYMLPLVTFLRDRLNNDSISLEPGIDPDAKEEPKRLPDKEFISHIVEQNPPLGEFLKNIDAEIAMI